MAQRSTKGASKQRRDAINDKISQMRELIPVSEAVRPRLSQLQVMALTNAYIAKSNFFERRYLEADNRSTFWSDLYDISPTLPGFLLVVSVADGRVLFVSDSVSEYLGNSAVDILTQMETVYELIDDRDREILRQAMQQQQQLVQSTSSPGSTEPWTRDVRASREAFFGGDDVIEYAGSSSSSRLSFTCRMNIAARGSRNNTTAAMQSAGMKFGFDRQKIMQVNGRFVRQKAAGYCSPLSYSGADQTSTHVLVAYCTPHLGVFNGSGAISGFALADNIEGNTNAFYSLHRADMKFVRIESNGEYHMNYGREAINGKSWYELIHPADIEVAKCKHTELLGDYQIGDTSSVKSLCVRIQSARGNFLWLHVVMRIHDNESAALPIVDSLPAMFNVNTAQPLIICTNHVIDEQMAAFLRARENELEFTAKSDCPLSTHHLHQSSGSSTCSQYGDDLIFPDFELSKLLDEVTNDAAVSRRPSSGQCRKRRYNDDVDSYVASRKVTKVIEEVDTYDLNQMPSMVLSMPSPPRPQWDFDGYEKSSLQMPSGQCLPGQSNPYGTGSLSSFAPHQGGGVMATSCAVTGTTVNGFAPVAPMQIQEPCFNSSRSSPFAAVPDMYMAVPDLQVNNLELDYSWDCPTMYGIEPVKNSSFSSVPPAVIPGLAKNSSVDEHGLCLPELDQSVIESVLGPFETVQGSVPFYQRNAPNPAAVGGYANEEGTDLIHELLYLGQEFLKSDYGSICNHVNPLNFV